MARTDYEKKALERLKVDFPFLKVRFITAAFVEYREDFIPTFEFLSRIDPEVHSDEQIRLMAPFYQSGNSILMKSNRKMDFIEELQPNGRLFKEVNSKSQCGCKGVNGETILTNALLPFYS